MISLTTFQFHWEIYQHYPWTRLCYRNQSQVIWIHQQSCQSPVSGEYLHWHYLLNIYSLTLLLITNLHHSTIVFLVPLSCHSVVPILPNFPDETLNWVLFIKFRFTDVIINVLPVEIFHNCGPFTFLFLKSIKIYFLRYTKLLTELFLSISSLSLRMYWLNLGQVGFFGKCLVILVYIHWFSFPVHHVTWPLFLQYLSFKHSLCTVSPS